jgi:hypothetical protein
MESGAGRRINPLFIPFPAGVQGAMHMVVIRDTQAELDS